MSACVFCDREVKPQKIGRAKSIVLDLAFKTEQGFEREAQLGLAHLSCYDQLLVAINRARSALRESSKDEYLDTEEALEVLRTVALKRR